MNTSPRRSLSEKQILGRLCELCDSVVVDFGLEKEFTTEAQSSTEGCTEKDNALFRQTISAAGSAFFLAVDRNRRSKRSIHVSQEPLRRSSVEAVVDVG